LYPDTITGGLLILWDIFTVLSLIFLVWDLFNNTPTMWVMKLAWILIVIYTGPVGLFIYLLSCRQPIPGTHDQFIAQHWKQSIGSMMHCVAGDATGIIIAASITFPFRLPSGLDVLIEYSAAFVMGLFIFQALFMKTTMGGNYLAAVRKTFFAETVSMNMVMVGMIPVMVILRTKIPGGDNPKTPLFWGIMSLATIAASFTAYPINSWMVGRGLKHGMMTAVPASQPAAAMSTPMHHKPGRISVSKAVGVFIITFTFLAISVWFTNLFVQLRLW
jgi:hypothetical protein